LPEPQHLPRGLVLPPLAALHREVHELVVDIEPEELPNGDGLGDPPAVLELPIPQHTRDAGLEGDVAFAEEGSSHQDVVLLDHDVMHEGFIDFLPPVMVDERLAELSLRLHQPLHLLRLKGGVVLAVLSEHTLQRLDEVEEVL
jgi:hypothetical protein